jgi:DNA-binding response OmpR family regulator
MDQRNKPQKIVVVEDNVDLLGYQCFVAGDGIAALYVIQKELPDLVLLDLMVPAIAGDEVLKRMRASEWGKTMPVIIISNLNEADAPAGLRDLGIIDYLVKVNLVGDQLDRVVNKILNPQMGTQS